MILMHTNEHADTSTFSWIDVVNPPHHAKGKRINEVPFSVEECLENNPLTQGKKCLDNFIDKGGLFHSVNPFSQHEEEKKPFPIFPYDDIRVSCSLGWCRSQTLHSKLSEFAPHKITLFSPHATRYGFDPYNDQINWNEESVPDNFKAWSGKEKASRVGYEHFTEWEKIEEPTIENLKPIKDFYDKNYFSCASNLNRRVYITFAANAHVILKRLNEVNQKLDNVVVVHIDLDDLITTPYHNHVPALSAQAFAAFSRLLDAVLDLSELQHAIKDYQI